MTQFRAMIREHALNIYVDGSSYSHPRGGGIGIRFVTIDAAGDEQAEDLQLPGYKGATNNEMELKACIVALKEVRQQRHLQAFEDIYVSTDSAYVANNYRNALFTWPKRKWRTHAGAPVVNVELWKQLIAEVKKLAAMRHHVVIQWVKGHSKDKHNRAADKLAKASARQAMNNPLSIVSVRRKLGTQTVQIGSVAMRGQRLAIRVVTNQHLPTHKLWRYKYEVLSKRSKYRSFIDVICSEHLLRDGHHYLVRVNRSVGNPMIVAVVRELER